MGRLFLRMDHCATDPPPRDNFVLCEMFTAHLARLFSRYEPCNQHLHSGSYKQEDHSSLQAAVHQIFNKAHLDLFFTQAIIENLDPKFPHALYSTLGHQQP